MWLMVRRRLSLIPERRTSATESDRHLMPWRRQGRCVVCGVYGVLVCGCGGRGTFRVDMPYAEARRS